MKVFGNYGSTCTRKVLMTLEEKKHTFEFQNIDMGKREQKSEEHLARQPFGVIPVLEDDGFQIYESRAIIHYLDRKLPGVSLTPTDLKDFGRMEQWLQIEQSYFSPAAMAIVYQMLFGKWRGNEPDMEKVKKGRADSERVLDVTEKALAGREYLAGSTFTLADISWMPYVEYLFASESGDLITSRPNVSAWWSRIGERPSWQKIIHTKNG